MPASKRVRGSVNDKRLKRRRQCPPAHRRRHHPLAPTGSSSRSVPRWPVFSGAPLIVAGSFLHDPLSDAVSSGLIESDLREHGAREIETIVGDTEAEVVDPADRRPRTCLARSRRRARCRSYRRRLDATRPFGRIAPARRRSGSCTARPARLCVAPDGLDEQWSLTKIGAGYIELGEGRAALQPPSLAPRRRRRRAQRRHRPSCPSNGAIPLSSSPTTSAPVTRSPRKRPGSSSSAPRRLPHDPGAARRGRHRRSRRRPRRALVTRRHRGLRVPWLPGRSSRCCWAASATGFCARQAHSPVLVVRAAPARRSTSSWPEPRPSADRCARRAGATAPPAAPSAQRAVEEGRSRASVSAGCARGPVYASPPESPRASRAGRPRAGRRG